MIVVEGAALPDELGLEVILLPALDSAIVDPAAGCS